MLMRATSHLADISSAAARTHAGHSLTKILTYWHFYVQLLRNGHPARSFEHGQDLLRDLRT